MLRVSRQARVVTLVSLLLALATFACGPKDEPKSANDERAPPAAASSSPDGAARAPTGGTLADQVAAEIRRLRPGTAIEIQGPLDLSVRTDQVLKIHLGNLDAECRTSPAACPERVSTFAQVVVSGTPGKPTESSVLLVLKSQAWITEMERHVSENGPPTRLATLPLVDDLRMLLVHDTPLLTKPLSEQELAELGWKKEATFERARSNLKGLIPKITVTEVAPEVYGVALENGYDAATMILHDQWANLKGMVAGDLVVAPIGRDLCFFTGTKNTQGLPALRKIVAMEKNEPRAPYPISTELYRWETTGWKRYGP